MLSKILVYYNTRSSIFFPKRFIKPFIEFYSIVSSNYIQNVLMFTDMIIIEAQVFYCFCFIKWGNVNISE